MSTDGGNCGPNSVTCAHLLITGAQALAQMRGANYSTSSVQGLQEVPNKSRNGAKEYESVDLVDTLRDIDVLSRGRGSVNSRPGNQRYWSIILRFRKQYQVISFRDADMRLSFANHVYKLVKDGGTRFMKRDRKNSFVEEQSEKESLEKIKQDLRGSYTPMLLTEFKTDPDLLPTREMETSSGNAALASQKETPPVPFIPKGNDSEFNNAERTLKLRDEDVLVGQGDGFNKHPGNVQYLAEVSKQQPEFRALKLKERQKRSNIAMNIFTWVVNRNGRFLRRQADGEYQELSISEALIMIKDALRDKRYRVGEQDDVEIDTTGPMTLSIQDDDVLAGPNSGIINHPGNLKYLTKLRKRQREYQALNLMERKKRLVVALDVFVWVTKRNGRFMRRDPEGGFQELPLFEALPIIQDDIEKGNIEFPSKAVLPPLVDDWDQACTGKVFQTSEKFGQRSINDVAIQETKDLTLQALPHRFIEKTTEHTSSEVAKVASNDLLTVGQVIDLLRNSSRPSADNNLQLHIIDDYETEPDTDEPPSQEVVHQRKQRKRARLSEGSHPLNSSEDVRMYQNTTSNRDGVEEGSKGYCGEQQHRQGQPLSIAKSSCNASEQDRPNDGDIPKIVYLDRPTSAENVDESEERDDMSNLDNIPPDFEAHPEMEWMTAALKIKKFDVVLSSYEEDQDTENGDSSE